MSTLKKYLPWLAVLVAGLSIYTPMWLIEHVKIVPMSDNYDDVFLPDVAILHNAWFLAVIVFASYIIGAYVDKPESFTGWKGVARGFSDVVGITSLVAMLNPHLSAIFTSVIVVTGARIIFVIIPPGRGKIKNWPKLGDCVETKVGEVRKSGIVQATYENDDESDDLLSVYDPENRTYTTVDPKAVKAGMLSIKIIPDEEAGFRADLYRPSGCVHR
jgi:hypothetical protein